jgi:hypothetical protein
MLTLSDIFDPEVRKRLKFVYELDNFVPRVREREQIQDLINISLRYKLLNTYERQLLDNMKEDFLSLLEESTELSFILNRLPISDKFRKWLEHKVFDLQGYRYKIVRTDYMEEKTEILPVIDYIQGKIHLINDYYVERELGRGGFGVVYLCVDSKTGEKVVVKQVKKETGEEKNEYDSLAYLRDECGKYFICVKEYISTEKDFYIVMEYLENYDELSKYRKEITFTIETGGDLTVIRKIIENICQGIKEMHKKGVAHNDIKLENIMVNYQTGDIRFIDFGLACIHDKCILNANEDMMGSPAYMDPAAVVKHWNKQVITEDLRMSGDIWSFGVLLYYLFVGSFPFQSMKITSLSQYFNNYRFSLDPKKDLILERGKLFNINMENLLTRYTDQRKLPC